MSMTIAEKIAYLKGLIAGAGITQETDPTVPDWAKNPTKPTYTAEEVGALPSDTAIPSVSGLLSKNEADGYYQPKGTYLTEHQDISGKADINHNHDDKYQAKGSYANADHTHPIDTVGVESVVDSYMQVWGTAMGEEVDRMYVQKETGKGLFSGSYNDLTNKPTIPSAVTDEHINGLIDAKITALGQAEGGSY